jgi:hypothetical protein
MPRPTPTTNLVKINVTSGVLEEVKKYIEKDKHYRNPTEFINECIRLRLFELRKTKIDERKLEAFFMREEQIRIKNNPS